MKTSTIKHFVIGALAVLSQVLIFQYLSIFGVYADPLLIFLLWLGIYYDRTQLLIFAAVLGLFQDALFDVWGVNMFAKILMVFIVSRFVKTNSEFYFPIPKVLGILFASAFVHNLIVVGLSTIIEAYTTGYSSIIFLIGGSLYTALVGVILYIFKGKG